MPEHVMPPAGWCPMLHSRCCTALLDTNMQACFHRCPDDSCMVRMAKGPRQLAGEGPEVQEGESGAGVGTGSTGSGASASAR